MHNNIAKMLRIMSADVSKLYYNKAVVSVLTKGGTYDKNE